MVLLGKKKPQFKRNTVFDNSKVLLSNQKTYLKNSKRTHLPGILRTDKAAIDLQYLVELV